MGKLALWATPSYIFSQHDLFTSSLKMYTQSSLIVVYQTFKIVLCLVSLVHFYKSYT